MIWHPVQSSWIRRVAWDQETGLLVVETTQEKLQAHHGFTAQKFDQFLASPSKGNYLYKSDNPAVFDHPKAERLDAYYPDETCCSKRIAKAITALQLRDKDAWECSVCGLEWECVDMGGMRFWRPKCAIPQILSLR